MIGQLGVHRALHQPLGQLSEQPTGTNDLLLRLSAGEQLIDQLITETLTQLGRQPLDVEDVRRRAAIPIRSPYGLTPRDGGTGIQLVGHLPCNRRHDTPLLVMPTQKIGQSHARQPAARGLPPRPVATDELNVRGCGSSSSMRSPL
jgi:hypothetical protein